MLRDVVIKYTSDWNTGKPHVYNCAEVMLRSTNEYYGLNLSDNELRMATGFGGGMAVKSVCGILTGAVMGLSTAFSNQIAPHKNEILSGKCAELMRRFEEKYGSVICDDIKDLGCIDIMLETADMIEEIWGI